MSLLRRIVAGVLAMAMVVSPAVACAVFCPQSGSIVEQSGSIEPNLQTAMPEDCADATNARTETSPQSHAPDCQGCSDCPAIASVKAPALAYASALSIDTPTVITVNLIVSPVAGFFRPARHRLTPPANGPPVKATPVILKDILRL